MDDRPIFNAVQFAVAIQNWPSTLLLHNDTISVVQTVITHSNTPQSLGRRKQFRFIVAARKNRAQVPQERALLGLMHKIRQEHPLVIVDKIKSEFPSITTDGLTSCTNAFNMPFTLSYIDNTWDLVTLVSQLLDEVRNDCGEDLVCLIKWFANDHDLKRCVVAGITDCEPSTVKAGRPLTGIRVLKHVGCTNHRLKSTTDLTF